MMRLMVDLSDVEEFIGTGQALAEAGDHAEYTSALFEHAYAEVNNRFNQEAAALAATGAIKHMYEWGTLGINTGRSNVRPQPMSERARLWNPVVTGTGLNHTVTFTFKPSVGQVPNPTKRDTGMSVDSIARLRRHTFMNKAMVMESGAEVTIMPKEAKALLIPLYKGKDNSWASDADRERGFTFRPGPITMTPGAKSQGTFTAFWTAFWEGRGGQLIENDIVQNLERDFELEFKAAGDISFRPKPAGRKMGQGIKSAKNKALKNVTMRAKQRRNGNGES